MIIQLLFYLRSRLPDLPFAAEFLDPGDKQNIILIQTNGGTAAGYPSNRVDQSIQVFAMHKDKNLARHWCETVFGTIREIHWSTLPGAPVGSGYEGSGAIDVFVQRLVATNPPTWGGVDEKGRGIYSFTVQATYADDTNVPQ